MSESPEQREDIATQNSEGCGICFSNVSKSFDGRTVLDGVSFEVTPGEALCILGRSGTGKSVTLKLMIGLMKADSGNVMVGDDDIGALDEEGLSRVRRKMGFLFQSAALFDSFTLNDNLAVPMRRLDKGKSPQQIQDAVAEALGQVGLAKDGAKMPVALSGGMRKRAGLARALMLQPEILLVDEPSSGLDRITSAEIDDLLLKVKTERRVTMVIVTHDIRGARHVGDKLAVLDQGKLIALGTPEELDQSDNELVQQFIGES